MAQEEREALEIPQVQTAMEVVVDQEEVQSAAQVVQGEQVEVVQVTMAARQVLRPLQVEVAVEVAQVLCTH